MASMETGNADLLIRTELWSQQIKEQLRDDLFATRWVDTLVDFPDGDTFTIPSIGDAQVNDYVEGEAVQYRPRDTGEWQFSIDEYLQSGDSISKKLMQDSFYAERLMARFVPDQNRAIMEHFEATTLEKPEAVLGATPNGQYDINGFHHRMSGGNSGVLEVQDFAYARLALQRANVPMTNLVAIVDPSTEFVMNTLSSLVTLDSNPMWEGIIADNIGTGMRFTKNIYGFDVYVSNYLPDVTDNALPERDGTTTNDFSTTAGKANYFFSAAGGDILPWKAAWRQSPEVDYKYEQDYQEHRWVTTCRYGVKLYRPENMVTIVTDTAVS